MIEVPIEKDQATQEKTLLGLLNETVVMTGIIEHVEFDSVISINGIQIILEKGDWGLGNFSKPIHVTGKLVRKNKQLFNQAEKEYFVLEHARI